MIADEHSHRSRRDASGASRNIAEPRADKSPKLSGENHYTRINTIGIGKCREAVCLGTKNSDWWAQAIVTVE